MSKNLKAELLKAVKNDNVKEFKSLVYPQGNGRKPKVSLFGFYKNRPLWIKVLKLAKGKVLEEAVRALSKSSRKHKGAPIEVAAVLAEGRVLRAFLTNQALRERLLSEKPLYNRTKEKLANAMLIELARAGRVKEVEELLENLKGELNVNAQDEAGNTPLHYAAYRGDEELVKTLLKFGARLEIQNSIGLTPDGILRFKGIEVGA
jgi:ankyrin repeat protein